MQLNKGSFRISKVSFLRKIDSLKAKGYSLEWHSQGIEYCSISKPDSDDTPLKLEYKPNGWLTIS